MNKRQAALKAGYAFNTARVAGSAIETEDVREVFRAVVDRAAGMDAVAKTLVDTLKATETKLAQYEGKFTDEREVPDHSARLAAVKAIAEYAGYYSPEPTTSIAMHTLTVMSEPSAEYIASNAPIDVSTV